MYDLTSDPHERNNLIASRNAQHVRIRATLAAKMHKRMVQLKDPALKPLSRIMFGSCIKQDKPMPIFKTIQSKQPEMFIFLGDNIYADTTDMKVMKAKYDKLAADPGFDRPYLNLAGLLKELGRPGEAAGVLSALLEAIPGHRQAAGMLRELQPERP